MVLRGVGLQGVGFYGCTFRSLPLWSLGFRVLACKWLYKQNLWFVHTGCDNKFIQNTTHFGRDCFVRSSKITTRYVCEVSPSSSSSLSYPTAKFCNAATADTATSTVAACNNNDDFHDDYEQLRGR